jgi:hypothetical protein
LRNGLILLLACVCLGFAQDQGKGQEKGKETPPADCKPIAYFGVSGCELSAQGDCPKGYHKQAACPANPMIKAPCRLICVKDGETKTKPKQGV